MNGSCTVVRVYKTVVSYQFSKLCTNLLLVFALLYLRSDSTTVPLADAKLSGQRDAFEKRLLNSIFFELIEKR